MTGYNHRQLIVTVIIITIAIVIVIIIVIVINVMRWKKITPGIIGCCPWNGFTTFGDQTHSSKMQSRSYFLDHYNHDCFDDHDEHDNCYYYYVFVNEC